MKDKTNHLLFEHFYFNAGFVYLDTNIIEYVFQLSIRNIFWKYSAEVHCLRLALAIGQVRICLKVLLTTDLNHTTMTSDAGIMLPSRLPLLLTHEEVLLPGSTIRFSVDSPRNMHLVRQRLLRGTSLKSTIIGVIPNTKDPEHYTDDLPSLHK